MEIKDKLEVKHLFLAEPLEKYELFNTAGNIIIRLSVIPDFL